MTALLQRMFSQIDAGNLAAASETLADLSSHSPSPEVCTQETLAELERARTLVLSRRSHILQSIRTLEASRLYQKQLEPCAPLWQLEA